MSGDSIGAMGGAATGGWAGAFDVIGGEEGKQCPVTTNTVNLAPESNREKMGAGIESDYLKQLQGLVGAGPGEKDATKAYGYSKDYGSFLDELSKTGGLPGEADVSRSSSLAELLYKPQQVALDQAFSDAMTSSNQKAAMMGRGINDPILAAKLQTEKMRQGQLLEANKGSTATGIAMALPGQRASYMGQANSVFQGLATQAMNNRSALLSIGTNIKQNEQGFRGQTAGSTSSVYQPGREGDWNWFHGATGWLKGSTAGAAGGAAVGNYFGGGGGGQPQTTSTYQSGQYNQPIQFSGANFGQSAPGGSASSSSGYGQGSGGYGNANLGMSYDLSKYGGGY